MEEGREEENLDIKVERTRSFEYGSNTEVVTTLSRYGSDDEFKQPLLRKRTNQTSQLAIVGANVSPIESLDYEYYLSSFS